MDEIPGIPIRVMLGARASSAELVVPALADPGPVTRDACLLALAQAEIPVTPEVERRVDEALSRLAPNTELRVVVAEARPPEHARDGFVRWHVGPEADPPVATDATETDADTDADASDTDTDVQIDHYARTSYVMVSEGQTLGEIVPPTEPVDGCDVKGRPLPGKRGRAAKFRHDETIEMREDGAIVALAEGVLSTTLGRWGVRDYLQIPGYVDFSTGNIDFSGDIEVVRGVRDCFTVRAEGNLEVQGLIEAAHLHTRGSLHARGGVAARERGTLTTGGDLTAKYLDGATVDVGGTMRVLREIINCDCTVHGDVESPNATLIGGRLTGVGRIRVATAGSPAGVTTDLVLGRVPRLEAKLGECVRLIEQVARQRESAPEGTPERQRMDERVRQLEETRARIREMIESERTIDVWVSLVIHAGTRFVLDGVALRLREDVHGPVLIQTTHGHGLAYRVGKEGDFRPLAERCDPDVRTAA